MSRIGINGLPYLLPLMLQVGFRKSALESGLLVSVTCVGIVLVRPAVAPLLRWLGFGRLLVLNTLVATACISAFASLRRASGDGGRQEVRRFVCQDSSSGSGRMSNIPSGPVPAS
jgi:hypothetical protein